jgi:putative transposase
MTEQVFKDIRQHEPHFLTFTNVEWVDILARKHCKEIIIESLKYCIQHKGLIVFAYVIMSNHMHLVVQLKPETEGLSGWIRDFKRHTSKQLIAWLLGTQKESRRLWMLDIFRRNAQSTYRNESFQVWQHGSHPFFLYSEKVFRQKIFYIHMNPVTAGIVRTSWEYVYSSAANYAMLKDVPLEVTLLDMGI